MRGLMLHISSRHAGRVVDDTMRANLSGLDRGMCVSCGGLRPTTSSTCHRCGCAGPPRSVRVGDVIQGTARQEAHLTAAGVDLATQPSVRDLPTGADRQIFLDRVRALSSNTKVHTPTSLRDRHAAILASILASVADGRVNACLLEKVRSKLLLSSVPRNRNKLVEFSVHLNLWAQQDLEQLLVRAEEQARAKVGRARRKTNNSTRGRRAKHLVYECACSRATTSLTSEIASLSTEDEKHLLICGCLGQFILILLFKWCGGTD